MDQHIPSGRRPDETPPITTADDMCLHWRSLMGPLGFSGRRLWVTILDPIDLVVPTLPVLEDLPSVPPAGLLRSFIHALADGLGGPDTGWSVGFLLSRSGRPSVTSGDVRYHVVLRSVAESEGLRLRSTFLATPADIIGLDAAQAA